MNEHASNDQSVEASQFRPRLTKAVATQLLQEAQESGLSLAAFARERGIVPHTLYNWREKLRKQRDEPAHATMVNVTAALQQPDDQVALVFPNGMRIVCPHLLGPDQFRCLVEAIGC